MLGWPALPFPLGGEPASRWSVLQLVCKREDIFAEQSDTLNFQDFIDFLDPFRPRRAGTTRGHRLAALEPPRPLQSPLLQTLDGRFLRLLGRGSDKMRGRCVDVLNYLLVGCVCIWVSSNNDPFGDVKNEVTLRFELTQDELNKKPAMFCSFKFLVWQFVGYKGPRSLFLHVYISDSIICFDKISLNKCQKRWENFLVEHCYEVDFEIECHKFKSKV